MMRLICVFLLLVPLTAMGQPGAKIPRMCVLAFEENSQIPVRFQPFFQGLRDLGYVDGKNITIDLQGAGGMAERYGALAAKCVKTRADVIVVTTTPAAQAAKKTTSTIPIVMHPLGDPVGSGLVASLARPGGNITGTTFTAQGMSEKRLSLLKEAFPRLSKVLLISDLPQPHEWPRQWSEL